MINKLLSYYVNSDISKQEIYAENYFVIENIFGYTKKDILMGKTLSEKEFEHLENIIQKRCSLKMPVQYVINSATFMGEKFYVDENVLIPRDDTEILVQTSINLIKKHNLKSALEIGTGSGIIAITLKNLLNLKITATDINSEALKIARKNAKNLDIKFIQSDLFKNIKEKYDIIISNPPYIPITEKENLQFEVKNFEPELALFTNDKYGIDTYKKIITQSTNYLNTNGFLVFEIGYNQAELIKDLFEKNNYKNIEIIKDVSGHNRVIFAQKI